MHVLLLNWLDRENPQAGGAEHHLHQCFGRLVAKGWKVTLVTSGWPGAPGRCVLDGIEVHRIGGRHTFAAAAPSYARGLLAADRYSLVVEDLNKVPLFAPRWTDLPVVLLVHHLFGRTAFHEARFPIAAATWILERPIPRVYRGVPIVAISQSTRDDLARRGLDPARIEVVENGVDAERFTPGDDGARFQDPTLLYLGRLKRYKRVDLVLRAAAALRAEGLPVQLLIAGEGDRRPVLEREARRLELGEGEIRFLGFISEDDKVRLLQRSWVHVLTSEKEGWGISILEAAACGTPSVASDVLGLRDSVLHEKTGLLVRHGDVSALARSIRRLLENEELRRAFGRAGRSFAEGLSWDRAAARLGRVFEDAVAASGDRR